GAGLFIAALLVSVLLDPRVWVLHTLQALIYVAVIVLAQRNSAWGFGAGLAPPFLWDGAHLFATGVIPPRVDALPASLAPRAVAPPGVALHTDLLGGPALVLSRGGAGGPSLMPGGSLAVSPRRAPGPRRWAELLGGAVLAVAALVLIYPLRTHILPLPLD